MKRAHTTDPASTDPAPTDPAPTGPAPVLADPDPDADGVAPTAGITGMDDVVADAAGADHHADAGAPDAAEPVTGQGSELATAAGAELMGWLARQGLPADTVVLVGPDSAGSAPMRAPYGTCGLTVTAVDLHADHDDRVLVFTGRWETGPIGQVRAFAGEVLIELAPAAPRGPVTPEPAVDVRMLLAGWGRWNLVGRWPSLGPEWPQVIAPTAAAAMRLYRNHAG